MRGVHWDLGRWWVNLCFCGTKFQRWQMWRGAAAVIQWMIYLFLRTIQFSAHFINIQKHFNIRQTTILTAQARFLYTTWPLRDTNILYLSKSIQSICLMRILNMDLIALNFLHTPSSSVMLVIVSYIKHFSSFVTNPPWILDRYPAMYLHCVTVFVTFWQSPIDLDWLN